MMTPQQLKNSILQRAIEGKLVEQRPEEGTANELLKQIKAEKDRLVKEGKIKKTKPLPPITEDEIPFDIPESWEWVRLAEIVRFKGGYAYKSGQYVKKSDNQIIRLGNVKNDKLLLDVKPVYIDNKYAIETEDYKIQNGDILFTMTGTRGKRDYFYSVYVQSIYLNLYLNQRVGCLKPYKSIFAQWLCHMLKTELVLQQVFINETGTANQGNIGSEKTMEILIPLPPLSEQHRIVAKIEELFPIVDEYDKAYSQLTALNEKFPADMKKSILQYAIGGKLVEQRPEEGTAADLLKQIKAEKAKLIKEGKIKKEKPLPPITEDEIPFDIPENWVWCRFGTILNFVNGRAYKQDELLDVGKYKVLRVGNFFTNENWYYSDLELDEDKYCNFGDLLYAWSASFGPKIWRGDKTIFHYHIWNVKYNKKILDRDYLYWYFKYDVVKVNKDTTGSAMKHVSMSNMLPRVIPVPPVDEQKRIVSRLEEILPLCDKLSL